MIPSDPSGYFVNLESSGKQPVYLQRSGNNLNIGSTLTSSSYTLSGVFNDANTNWMLFGVSIGWTGDTAYNENELWGYYYQSGNTENSGCVISSSFTQGKFTSTTTVRFKFQDMNGYVKELYVMDYMQVPSVFQLYKSVAAANRYEWRTTNQFYTQPGHVCNGWGNSLVLSTESTEYWDDGNLINGDGCSSMWQFEPTYGWTPDLMGQSVWAVTWGNSKYESQFLEEWDDGNLSNQDGCSSVWKIESTHTWTKPAGALSVCTPICGDGTVFSPETWDDGNKSDGQGWLSSCLGIIPGWACTGGSKTSATTWHGVWGDSYVTVDEQWNDQNTIDLDGCSSTWTIETGWTWVNDTFLTKTTCTAICGDGLRVKTENWDDGNSADNIGCKTDWSGALFGYSWAGGSVTTKDAWTTVCGDGYFRGTEQWDDGNAKNGDGWSSTWSLETGFSWINYPSSKSIWTSVCGDGYRVGSETWDDGNSSDNKGWLSDCSGFISGWTWSGGGTSSVDVWSTIWGDGIHISYTEEWDDGNLSSVVDGWNSKCTIDSNWSWSDYASKSVCVPLWGNGKRDGSDEKCDDGNYISGDGCSNWLVDNKWQWIGGDATNFDTWYEMPTPTLTSVSGDNTITVKFSQSMKTLNPIPSDAISWKITGPYSNYEFSVVSKFKSSTTLTISVKSATQLTGNEVIYISFLSQFLSTNGVNVYNNQVSGTLNKVPVYPDIIAIAGMSTNAIMTSSIASIVSANMLLSQSWELLWGFLNTMQLIYFFPLLSHYFPDLYMQFLIRLSSSKMDFDFF